MHDSQETKDRSTLTQMVCSEQARPWWTNSRAEPRNESVVSSNTLASLANHGNAMPHLLDHEPKSDSRMVNKNAKRTNYCRFAGCSSGTTHMLSRDETLPPLRISFAPLPPKEGDQFQV
jgi:hypothetical protein